MKMFLDRGLRFRRMFEPILRSHLSNFPVLSRCVCCTNVTNWKSKLSDNYSIYKSPYQLEFLRNVYNYKPPKYRISKNDISIAYYCDSKNRDKDTNVKKESLFKRMEQVSPYKKLNVIYKSLFNSKDTEDTSTKVQKPSLIAKMKQLSRDYWHILLPVHIVTSMGWIAILYAAIKYGVDIVKILEYINLSEKYLESLRNSSAGNWAMVYVLYKICTPLRYTITVGCTTMAIGYLSKRNYLKASSFKKPLQTAQFKKRSSEKADTKTERNSDPPKT